MSKQEHTPGPWKADSYGVILAIKPGKRLETICTTPQVFIQNALFDRKDEEHIGAWLSAWCGRAICNARLIAAAPDLLAALLGLSEWVQDNFEGEDSGPSNEDWEPVWQAIEKARGQA